MIAAIAVAAFACAPAAFATTFPVTSTADSGAGSLRQAIADANTNPGPDTIAFALTAPESVIQPATPLPPVTEDVMIDASGSQGSSGAPLVQIDGATASAGPHSTPPVGLEFQTGTSTVQGLSFTGWTAGNASAIKIDGGANVAVRGNYIGTDATLASGKGNYMGIDTDGIAQIGGASAGTANVIVGSNLQGVNVLGSGSIQSNLIGNLPTGAPLPNGTGIVVQAPAGPLLIGGTDGGGNDIAYNSDAGIRLIGGSGVTIRGNRIDHNGGLGITLGFHGVTPTPNDPGDADSGPNGLQNFPVLTAVTGPANAITVTGNVDAAPSTTYAVDFYASAACDGSGNGEGAVPLGATSVSTDGAGHASFSFAASVPGGVITATATAPDGSTSEFSPCVTATAGGGGSSSAGGATGFLAGSVVQDPSQSQYDLTAIGTEDWAVWGFANGGTSTSLAPDDRRAGSTAISALQNIDPAPSVPLRGLGSLNPPYAFSWTNGSLLASQPSVLGGIQHDGEQTGTSTNGHGFKFSLPADTTTRTATIWVTTNRADGRLTASLSDGSAPAFVDTLPQAADTRAGVYTIVYNAASAGQTLDVEWVETYDNCAFAGHCDNAALYAVALAGPAAPPPTPPVNTVVPSISGNPSVGFMLHASSGTWDSPANFGYQWARDGSDIGGAQSADYRVHVGDIGHALTVRVTASSVSNADVSAAAVSVATPVIPPLPANGQLVWSQLNGDFQQIYVLRPGLDGTQLTSAATVPGNNTEPAVSPDGSQIAFVNDGSGSKQIWVMGSNGSNARQLVPSQVSGSDWPAWSPDGSSLAFTTTGVLETYPLAGGVITVLAGGGGNALSSPSWSPDGKTIAVANSKDGSNALSYIDVATHLRSDFLTTATGAPLHPSYTPDGSAIYFAVSDAGHNVLERYDVESTAISFLTSGSDLEPAISVDGAQIAWIHDGLLTQTDVGFTQPAAVQFVSPGAQDPAWGVAPPLAPGPTVTLDYTPSDPSTLVNGEFTYRASAPTATFECWVDDGGADNCGDAYGYVGLSPGTHTFNVRATDGAGTGDPATFTWTIAAPAAAGTAGSTERVSVTSSKGQLSDSSNTPSISDDGNLVGFQSVAPEIAASGLALGPPRQVFLHNRETGATTDLSLGIGGGAPDGPSSAPKISHDGTALAFSSTAENMTDVTGANGNASDVFVWKSTGLTRITRSAGASQGAVVSDSAVNGTNVTAFDSSGNDFRGVGGVLITDGNETPDVYAWSSNANRFQRVSGVTLTQADGNGASTSPAINGNGGIVAYQSTASNLVPGDGNGQSDIFLRDLGKPNTILVSRAFDGSESNGRSTSPSISADGRTVAFLSTATNLVPGGTPAGTHAFVWDRSNRTVFQADVDSKGVSLANDVNAVAISGDGARVVFSRRADNTGAQFNQVYVHDLVAGSTTPMSVTRAGTLANGNSFGVATNDNASVTAFDSNASNLVAGDTNATSDVFVRDEGASPVTPEIAHIVASNDVDSIDPAYAYTSQSWQIQYATGLGLLNYSDARGARGSALQPEAATGLPAISADGLTYTFTVRPGLKFSNGADVTADSFRTAFLRVTGATSNSPGRAFVSDVAGVTVAGNQITYTLTKPDADFLARISMPFFQAVPAGTPAGQSTAPIPSAGPYYIDSYAPGSQIVLKLNPNYTGARPRGFKEFDYDVNVSAADAETQVIAGTADYAATGVPTADWATVKSAYGAGSPAALAGHQQYFVNPSMILRYVAMNTARPLFSDPRLRQAVNFAIDRPAITAARLGADGGTPTDQYLVPGMPGYVDGDFYPLGGPDLAKATALAAAAGVTPATPKTAVLWDCNNPACDSEAHIIAANLAPLGINVAITELPRGQQIHDEAIQGAAFDLTVEGWASDYPDPSDTLNVLLDGNTIQAINNNNVAYFNDPTFNSRFEAANMLTGRLRFDTYAQIESDVVKQAAPWAAYAVQNSRDFFSARIGCHLSQAIYGVDLAAMCDSSAPAAVTSITASLSQDSSTVEPPTRVRIGDIPVGSVAGGTDSTPSGAPVAQIPVAQIPVAQIPVAQIDVANAPVAQIPVAQIGLGDPNLTAALATVPLSQLPLRAPRSWATVLAGTPLATFSPQSVSLGDVLALSPLPDAFAGANGVAKLRLSDFDFSRSTLGNVPIVAWALGGATLSQLPLPGGISWCVALHLSPSCPANLDSQTFLSESVAGAPVAQIPVAQISVRQIPVAQIPVAQIPVAQIGQSTFKASPVAQIPVAQIDVSAANIAGAPVAQIPVAQIAVAGSPVAQIPVAQIPVAQISTLIDCGHVDCSSTTLTLGQAAAAGAIRSAFTLGVLVSIGAIDGIKLGDIPLAAFGTITIGQLIAVLPSTVTLGDIMQLLVGQAAIAWEQLPFAKLGVQRFAADGGITQMHAQFALVGSGIAAPATVTVTLPVGAVYSPGSSLLHLAGVSGATVLPDPTTTAVAVPAPNGTPQQTLTWSLASIPIGDTETIDFKAFPPLTLGITSSSLTANAGGAAAPATDSQALSVADPESDHPNDTPATAPVLDPQSVYFGYITTPSDVDYFRIPSPAAGTRVLVRIGQTGADDDLVVYSPTSSTLHATGLTGQPIDGAPILDGGVDVNNQNSVLAPQVSGDVPLAAGLGVAGMADGSGSGDTVTTTSSGTGGYYTIQVSGYNGATSNLPYTVHIEEIAPPPAPQCPARTFPPGPLAGGSGVAGSVPAIPANANTLFLFDKKRFGDTYGATAAQNVQNSLNELGTRTTMGVSGVVVPVEAYNGVQAAYNNWDAAPCDPNLANRVADRIAGVADSIRATHPGIKFIVNVGGDDIVPFFRIPDNTTLTNENGYATMFGSNQYFGAAYNADALSDDPYATTAPIAFLDRQMFVPDLVVSRLVETAPQITQAVSQYESASGRLTPTTGYVSGYDFLADGSNAVADALAHDVTGGVTRHIDPFGATTATAWTKTQLLQELGLLPVGTPASILAPNGHYDHARALTSKGGAEEIAAPGTAPDPNELWTTQDVLNAVATAPALLRNKIIFTMGCHAGLPLSDALLSTTQPPSPLAQTNPQDWAQTYAGAGAIYIANTGFGIGDTASVAYSEQLMTMLAQHLDGSVRIGEALSAAKEDYFSNLTAVSVYDEKAMNEAELYGLPMWTIGVAQSTVAAAVAAPAATLTRAFAAAPTLGAPGLDPVVGLNAATFSADPTFTKFTNARGDYYSTAATANDFTGYGVTNYRPIEPKTSVALPATNDFRGALILHATSADETGWNPAVVRPTIDSSLTEPALSFASDSWPSRISSVTTARTISGRRQKLELLSGAFFTDTSLPADGQNVQRRWTHLDGDAFYNDTSTDFKAPTFQRTLATTVDATHVAFSAQVFDTNAAGAQTDAKVVYVLFRDSSSNVWKGVFLQQAAAGAPWTGGAPVVSSSQIEFFVQACDTAGNCSSTSDKARYFSALPPAAGSHAGANGTVTLAVSAGTPGQNGYYLDAVTLTATDSSADVSLTSSIDGGAAQPVASSGLIPVSGSGVHTIVVNASDGGSAAKTVLIDSADPTIALMLPVDGGVYVLGASASVSFTCSDIGSGIQTCTGTQSSGASLDTSAVGSHTFTVTATDIAGRTTRVTRTYQVTWAFDGFLIPVKNPPLVNRIVPGWIIPVRFRLGGNRGLRIFAAGYPTVTTTTCPAYASTSDVNETLSASGAAILVFNPFTRTYLYIWKTPNTWPAGQCRLLTMKFIDGTTHTALFRAR